MARLTRAAPRSTRAHRALNLGLVMLRKLSCSKVIEAALEPLPFPTYLEDTHERLELRCLELLELEATCLQLLECSRPDRPVVVGPQRILAIPLLLAELLARGGRSV